MPPLAVRGRWPATRGGKSLSTSRHLFNQRGKRLTSGVGRASVDKRVPEVVGGLSHGGDDAWGADADELTVEHEDIAGNGQGIGEERESARIAEAAFGGRQCQSVGDKRESPADFVRAAGTGRLDAVEAVDV